MNPGRFTEREKKDAELVEEIDSHLAHEQDANAARGLSSEEARRQARMKFGDPYSTRFCFVP
jgi:putative ABC transport system permease protein